MLEITDIIGIVAFAASGFFVAIRSKLDLLGILISSFLTALGGGLMRDIIVDKKPFIFIYNYPAVIVLMVVVFLIIFNFHKKPTIENKTLFIISDSIGLSSFSISGALVALESGFNFTGVLVLSFITAVGGGISRDIIINEIPFVFKTGFYGTISILIAAVVFLLNYYHLIALITILIIFTMGVLIRLIAFYKKWKIAL